jgi:hypothetical protein
MHTYNEAHAARFDATIVITSKDQHIRKCLHISVPCYIGCPGEEPQFSSQSACPAYFFYLWSPFKCTSRGTSRPLQNYLGDYKINMWSVADVSKRQQEISGTPPKENTET